MKNLISGVNKAAATGALALAGLFASSAASATCTNANNQPVACPPPTSTTYSSGTPAGTTNNGGIGQGGDSTATLNGTVSGTVNGIIKGENSLTSDIKNSNAVTVAPVINAAGGAATIGEGAVKNNNNNSATATVAPGAVVANPTATATNAGNNVNIDARQAKQATSIVAPGLVGGVDGCVAISSISGGISAVGVGGITLGATTGASMVEGCAPARDNTIVVQEGIRSDDPAKIVIGYRSAGKADELKHLTTPEGQAEMALFQPRTVQNSYPTTVVVPAFQAAATTQPTLPPCVIPGKKASWKVIANGTMVCSPDGN